MNELFKNAQEIFKQYRRKFLEDNILKTEFLDAIKKLLSLYDTKIYENRFIVGGVVEFIILASFKGLNFQGKHIGKENERFDIEIFYNNCSAKFSIKSVFIKSESIRLINVLGESIKSKWDEPTIFILPHCGIGYADATLINRNKCTRRTKDAILIKRKCLEDLFKIVPEFFIPLKEIPYKNDIIIENKKLASENIAVELLKDYTKLKL